MAIENTEAIVLKRFSYGDTSYIITLYSEGFGKIPLIAKGVKSNNHSYGLILEPANIVNVEFYLKPKRDLNLLKSGSLVQPSKVKGEGLFYMFPMLEVTDKLSHNFSADPKMWGLIRKTFTDVKSFGFNEMAAFLLKVLHFSGYGINTRACSCTASLNGNSYYAINKSCIVCKDCAKGNNVLDLKNGPAIFDRLLRTSISEVGSLEVSEETQKAFIKMMQNHFVHGISSKINSLDLL
jgi:DNA repair protein RecO